MHFFFLKKKKTKSKNNSWRFTTMNLHLLGLVTDKHLKIYTRTHTRGSRTRGDLELYLNTAGLNKWRIQSAQRKAHWIHSVCTTENVNTNTTVTVGSRTMSKTVNFHLWKIKNRIHINTNTSEAKYFLGHNKAVPWNAVEHFGLALPAESNPTNIITQYVTIFLQPPPTPTPPIRQ